MKTRKGFVSNSSSSSFVIAKEYLTEEQIEAIKNHATEGKKYNIVNLDCPWGILEDEYLIEGYTSMDNFDMREFFENINVPMHKVIWN